MRTVRALRAPCKKVCPCSSCQPRSLTVALFEEVLFEKKRDDFNQERSYPKEFQVSIRKTFVSYLLYAIWTMLRACRDIRAIYLIKFISIVKLLKKNELE